MVWMLWDSPSFTSYSSSFLLSQTKLQNHRHLVDRVQRERVWKLQSSTRCEIQRDGGQGAVNALDVDGVDERFMLAGSISGGLSIFDLQAADNATTDNNDDHNNISNISRQRQKKKVVIKPLKQNLLRSKKGHLGLVSSVDWYPHDCGVFIASSVVGTVALYDTSSMEKVMDFDFPEDRVNWCKFRPNVGSRPIIATAVSNGSITLCDLNSGDKAHTIHAHNNDVSVVDWHPSYDYLLVSGSIDGTVKVWDIRKGGTSTPVMALDWRQDYAYTAGKDVDVIRSHNQGAQAMPAYRHQLHSNKHNYGIAHEGMITSLRYSPCGQFLISTGNDRKIRTWLANEGKLLPINYETSVFSKLPFRLSVATFGHSGDDLLVVPNKVENEDEYSPSGKVTLLPMHSGSGRPIKILKGHFGCVEAAVFRNASQSLVSAGSDGMVLYWECKDIFAEDSRAKDVNRKYLQMQDLTQPLTTERRSGLYCHYRGLRVGGKRKASSSSAVQFTMPSVVKQPFVPRIVENYMQRRLWSKTTRPPDKASNDNKVTLSSTGSVLWNRVNEMFRPTSEPPANQDSSVASSSSASSSSRVVPKTEVVFEKTWKHIRRDK